MANLVKRLWDDEQGQDLAEYGIALAVIALAVIAAVTALGTEIAAVWNRAVEKIQTAPQ